MTTVTFEEITPFLPMHIELHYVDRNDSFDNSLSALQNCIRYQNYDSASELIFDWFDDTSENTDYYINELKSNLENHFNKINIDIDVNELVEEYNDEILEYLRNNDKSTIYKDLMRNTGKVIMFYDTGYEMESESWRWSTKRVAKECVKILKHLGFKSSEIAKLDRNRGKDKLWTTIWDCVQNASYGGSLEIYFRDDIDDFIKIDEKFNSIVFKNPTIGIIDHGGGSGYQDLALDCSITLPLNPNNIFIEKTVSYNWTYDIAGMCHDAYDSTNVQFLISKSKRIIKDSNLIKHLAREEKYQKTFDEGGCTFGDMHSDRHRNQTYINHYPCGNKCLDCGTFWID